MTNQNDPYALLHDFINYLAEKSFFGPEEAKDMNFWDDSYQWEDDNHCYQITQHENRLRFCIDGNLVWMVRQPNTFGNWKIVLKNWTKQAMIAEMVKSIRKAE